jgi:hypothetical protein
MFFICCSNTQELSLQIIGKLSVGSEYRVAVEVMLVILLATCPLSVL